MRASTFFALFIAVLLGFAALGAARYFHLFTTATVQKEAAAKPELPKVLVAKKNLYEGIAMTANDVQVRELRADELDDYKKNPGDYLPPTVEAAVLRVMNTNLLAGQVLLNKHVEPIVLPPGLPGRISPKMVAVNVAVTKDRAAGGLIRNDDYVDVYLTAAITGDKNAPAVYKTAQIAQNLCVIVKRDMLWPVLAAVPENKPLQFTLEANPYRAALIDYAKTKGQMTLVPTSRAPRPKNVKLTAPAMFSIPGSKEYQNEGDRVEATLRGDRSLGDGDLERIFGLGPLMIRETVQIETFTGTKKSQEPFQFVRLTNPSARRAIDPDQPNYGYRFSVPPTASAEPAPATLQSPFMRPLAGAKPR